MPFSMWACVLCWYAFLSCGHPINVQKAFAASCLCIAAFLWLRCGHMESISCSHFPPGAGPLTYCSSMSTVCWNPHLLQRAHVLPDYSSCLNVPHQFHFHKVCDDLLWLCSSCCWKWTILVHNPEASKRQQNPLLQIIRQCFYTLNWSIAYPQLGGHPWSGHIIPARFMISVFLGIGHFDETVGGITADSVSWKKNPQSRTPNPKVWLEKLYLFLKGQFIYIWAFHLNSLSVFSSLLRNWNG